MNVYTRKAVPMARATIWPRRARPSAVSQIQRSRRPPSRPVPTTVRVTACCQAATVSLCCSAMEAQPGDVVAAVVEDRRQEDACQAGEAGGGAEGDSRDV